MNLKARQEIYEFVKKNPGLNILQISKKMSIPFTTLKYHLKHLEKLEIIKIKSDGKSKFVYDTYKMGRQEKEIFEFLRKDIPCKIIVYIYYSIFCSQIELSKALDLPPAHVSYYTKKMIDKGIIDYPKTKNGRVYPYPEAKNPYWKKFNIKRKAVKSEKFYTIKDLDISRKTTRLLISHKNSLGNKNIIDILLGLFNESGWFKMSEEEKIKQMQHLEKNYVSVDNSFDVLLDFIKDFFKPPFAA